MNPRRHSGRPVLKISRAIVAAVTSLIAACSPPPPGSGENPCPELPGPIRSHTSPWVFALCERVHPFHVHTPHNDAEDVVFRHLYEGLVDVDCQGELVPALATAWTPADDARVWTFELRGDATFGNGEPVTAAAVRDAWRRTRSLARGHAHRSSLWADLRVRDLHADGLVLTVRLTDGDPDLPFRLAEPEFFVMKPSDATWPLGTRGRIPVTRELPDGGTEISFVAATGGRASSVRFRVLPDGDPRDVFRADVHALLTRDRRVLSFLEERGDARVLPLQWNRRYTLVDPTGAFTWLESALPLLRTELVRDVLPGVARAPWDPGRGKATPPTPTEAYTVRFSRHDRDAIAAAERVAALASRRGDGRRWIVAAIAAALTFGGADPAVVALPRTWFDPPPTRRRQPPFPVPGTTYPLAETRTHLVTRPGIGGIRTGWDGVPRLDEAGWTIPARRVLP